MCLYYWWGSVSGMKMARVGLFFFTLVQNVGTDVVSHFLLKLKVKTAWVQDQITKYS